MDIQPTYEIPLQRLKDLLDSAGRGSAYWCDSPLQMAIGVEEALTRKGITVCDKEESPEEKYNLNIFTIKKGLQVMAEKDLSGFSEILTGTYDNATGDRFMQYALFGDVIYG